MPSIRIHSRFLFTRRFLYVTVAIVFAALLNFIIPWAMTLWPEFPPWITMDAEETPLLNHQIVRLMKLEPKMQYDLHSEVIDRILMDKNDNYRRDTNELTYVESGQRYQGMFGEMWFELKMTWCQLFMIELRAGWPCRSIAGYHRYGDFEENRSLLGNERLGTAFGGPAQDSWYFVPPQSILGIKLNHHLDKYLIYKPLWMGFLVNTALYASILIGCFYAAGMMKSLVRRVRKQCPKCNYILADRFDEGCPECGWGREPTERLPSQ